MKLRSPGRGARNGRQPFRQDRRARKGFTLVEVSIAVIVLLVGLMALSGSAVRVQSLGRTTRGRMAAQNALRAKAEEIRSISRAGLSDPLGWGTHVINALQAGSSFPVEGLTPVQGAAAVGSVSVITNETATDADLGVELGLPRDLDGDGLASNPAVTTTAHLLPVVVRVRWASEKGDQQASLGLWILGY